MAVTHLVVVGLMGSGKTSIGRRVAERLGRAHVDGDERLEARTGRTAAEVAESDGLTVLHRLEAEVLHEALAAPEPSVVAPAASIVDDDRCLDALAGHVVVWLTAPAAHLARDAKDKQHRPLVGQGDDEALFARQRAEREPRIAPLAALVIDVSAVDKDEAADLIVRQAAAADPSAP